MRRSGVFLKISAMAAFLTCFAQPMVQASADQWTGPVQAMANLPAALPGMRPASIALSPTRVAGVERAASRTAPVTNEAQELWIKSPKPVRRLVREGCETALSPLVSAEARRMTPGRCIS